MSDNTPLDIYEQFGFKFFLCNADKTPAVNGDWKSPDNHLSKDQALQFQSTGKNIGAAIPANVICINLSKNPNKKDGGKAFNEVLKKYRVPLQEYDTFVVTTSGQGSHVFFQTDKKYSKGPKEESIELLNHGCYVIAAGSPGYTERWSTEIRKLFPEFETWLNDCEGHKEKKEKIKKLIENDRNLLSPKVLDQVLLKVDATQFREEKRFIEFVSSIFAACGNDEKIIKIIDDWIKRDPTSENDEKRDVKKRLPDILKKNKITVGTFIHYLKEQEISNYLLNQVLNYTSVSEVLNASEKQEIQLPFADPDYFELAASASMAEFFNYQGHTSAAKILHSVLLRKVMFVESEGRKNYYFDNSKWMRLNDIYSIIYTILNRTLNYHYKSKPREKEFTALYMKCLKCLNDRRWKESVFTEFNHREGIFNEYVDWDSPEISETITCIDGVIDFKRDSIVKRVGYYSEFRRSFVPYKCEEILSSKEPEKFLKFLSEIMPDAKTRETLDYCLSLNISGNTSKRLFQIWHGSGKNGKSALVNIIHKVLDDGKVYKYNTNLILNQRFNKESYDLANFKGKYLCYSSEVSKWEKLNTQVIKDLTGNESINARQIREESQNFRPTWQMVFIANDLPEFDSDSAISDRIMIIPFDMRFYKNEKEKNEYLKSGTVSKENLKPAKEQKYFLDEIFEEKAAIIKWMVFKYIELQNKHKGVIPISPKCELKKQKYVEENDTTALFIKEYCVIDVNDTSLFASTEELCEKYREFIGKDKISEKYIKKEILSYDSRLQDTKRSVEVEHKDYSTGAVSFTKVQRRGLKFIRLKTMNEIERDIEEEIKDDTLGRLL